MRDQSMGGLIESEEREKMGVSARARKNDCQLT